ncbi:EF-hand domain-containing protein [Streptomyces sp. NPDC052101]|uniref:EF-hand domain-containing protein n=1 Tax=Streptomyces sp. NPDC052101 TaxID=3155763 RepID=UPI003444C0A5
MKGDSSEQAPKRLVQAEEWYTVTGSPSPIPPDGLVILHRDFLERARRGGRAEAPRWQPDQEEALVGRPNAWVVGLGHERAERPAAGEGASLAGVHDPRALSALRRAHRTLAAARRRDTSEPSTKSRLRGVQHPRRVSPNGASPVMLRRATQYREDLTTENFRACESQKGKKMPEGILREKMAKLFEAYDADGNGYIERRDFETVAERINDSLSDAGSQHAAAVTAVFQEVWEGLASRMDADGDQRISLDEFITDKLEAARTGADASHTRKREELRRRLFEAMDRDGDGKVSMDEYRGFFRAFGVSATDAEKAFARLDVDKDGFLTIDEMIEATLEYNTNADPQASSSDLLGPLESEPM